MINPKIAKPVQSRANTISGDGHVITIGSIAGIEPYPGGAGYNAAKHAVRAVMDVLRMELLGHPVRVSEIDPGMVETEFSLVRFGGDENAAAKVYEAMTPLTADDIADCIAWVATRHPERPVPGSGDEGIIARFELPDSESSSLHRWTRRTGQRYD